MPTAEPIYEAINGDEARKILKRAIGDEIDKIKYLKIGNSFHELKLDVAIVLSAFPADCPVPEADITIIKATPEVGRGEIVEFLKQKNAAEELEKKKELLLASIDKIDSVLATIKLMHEADLSLAAGRTPDNLRVQHGLSTPMLTKTKGGGRVEVMVDHNK